MRKSTCIVLVSICSVNAWSAPRCIRPHRLTKAINPYNRFARTLGSQFYHQSSPLQAKPKSGSVVDSYQTVSVNCSKCQSRLFRYKKKNGTKSNLIKCYVERIVDDCFGLLENDAEEWFCPNCQTKFARSATIHGRPALKLVGGKVRMTKK